MEAFDSDIRNIVITANKILDILDVVNILVDKSEYIRELLEADIEAYLEWENEISAFLDALDEVEGMYEWECLQPSE